METSKINHTFTIDNRRRGLVTGVTRVISLSDTSIVLDTSLGKLSIIGKAFVINSFSVDNGEVSFDGDVDCVKYFAPKIPLIRKLLK